MNPILQSIDSVVTAISGVLYMPWVPLLLVVAGLGMNEIKTRTFQGFLNAVEADKAVVVTSCANVVKSARNIPGVVTTPANLINVYDIVNANQLIIDKAALATIEEVFA